MLKKMLNNKTIVITSITIVILALVILLVKCGQDEPTDTESESDTGVKQEETYDGDGLEVNEDGDEKTENSADSSGYWEDTEDSGNNTDKTNTKQEDITTSQTTGNKTEKPEYENDVSDEDTLEDGTSWGAIY